VEWSVHPGALYSDYQSGVECPPGGTLFGLIGLGLAGSGGKSSDPIISPVMGFTAEMNI
jgi:hypothetical protein